MCRDLQSLVLEMRNRTVKVVCISRTMRKHFDTEAFVNCKEINEALHNIKVLYIDNDRIK